MKSILTVITLVMLTFAINCGTAPTAVTVPTVPPPTTAPPATAAAPTFTPTAAPATKLTDPAASANSSPVEFVWSIPFKDLDVNAAGVADVDAQGNIYLVDFLGQVVKLDPEGKVAMRFGSKGSGEGQFNTGDVKTPLYPDPVAGIDLDVAPDGTIYVADGGNFRVQAFDDGGKFLRQWGKQGQADGEFEVPWAISTDAQGNVYVGDFTGTIQKFDPNGTFLARYGKGRGNGKGQFVGAVYELEVDAQGNLYTADRKSGRIQIFDPNGTLVVQWDTCSTSILDIRGLAVDGQGKVYVPTAGGHRVCIYAADGTLTAAFGKQGLRDGEFIFGDVNADIAVDSQGNLYVADSAGERIQKFRPIIKTP